MNTGKTLFAQIMDFLPWSTFDRILPGEFGSADRTAVISSRYRSLHMSHVPVFARARYLCKNSCVGLRRRPRQNSCHKSRPLPRASRGISDLKARSRMLVFRRFTGPPVRQCRAR